MTIVCGDSHTSTNGALGAWGWGIGISDVEHVLATQTLALSRPRTMRVWLDGGLTAGVSAKDLVLALIGHIGTAGASGYALELAGPAVTALDMDARFTLCNMGVEAGARGTLIAPDDKTISYVKGRPFAPKAAAFDAAAKYWQSLASDDGAEFDLQVDFDAGSVAPQVTWGTSPEQVIDIGGRVPDPAQEPDLNHRQAMTKALGYMGLEPGQSLVGLPVDIVFIGSCTNSRLSDLRAAAEFARGNRVRPGVRAVVVPGSGQVKRDAEALGLDRIFKDAGFEWREPGCSMCVSLGQDRVGPRQRCVATTNRNFEGRQGPQARTHLVSPAVAAATAVAGVIADPRRLRR
jgi:3-isopropylmalate/(R)-2-methylmalate dehydratase large subunit